MNNSKLKLLHNNRNSSQMSCFRANNARIIRLNRKTKNLFRDEDLENFGLGKKNPTYRCDVNGSINATNDYYLNTRLLIPVGTIFSFGGSSSPDGYLVCDGSTVSRDTYQRLFSIISTVYGVGDGATTFNLPDLRGRTLVGSGQQLGATLFNLGNSGGSETHQLQVNELPSHNHTGTTNTDGAHNHSISSQVQKTSNNTPDGLDGTANEIDNINTITRNTSTNGDHTHSFTTNDTGNNDPHNIMQPYLVINYIIRY